MKTCQLFCTPVSVSNAGYSSLSPGLYTGISVSDKVYEDQCQLHCYPVYQSGYISLSLEVYTRISVSDKVYEDLPATVSNLGYTLEVYRSIGISVGDKVYVNLSATLLPGRSASNPGYNGLSSEMFLEYRKTVLFISKMDKEE